MVSPFTTEEWLTAASTEVKSAATPALLLTRQIFASAAQQHTKSGSRKRKRFMVLSFL
jgi:hypothetical protein